MSGGTVTGLPASDALVVADTTGMDRVDWLEVRRDGIGGSDAATVCGLNPWESPFSLWVDKTRQLGGGAESDEDDIAGEAATWGTLLEPIVRDEVARREQLTIDECPLILAHPERTWQRADLDGIIVTGTDDPGVYEGKTAHTYLAGDWDDDQIPARYIVQVQHYLAVTGWEWALVACLVGGQRLVTRRLARDPELIDVLTDLEADFWEHVEAGEPPAPDGSAATTDVLTRIYDAEPGLVEVVDEATVTEILARRAQADADIKAATEAKEQANNELRLLLGEATEAHTPDGRCLYTWRPQSSRRLDAKALRAAHPDIADEYTTITESRVLRVKKGTTT